MDDEFDEFWKAPENKTILEVARRAEEMKAMKASMRRLYVDETITVAATDGIVTEEQARRTFPGGIDPDLLVWASKAMPQTKAAVHELGKEGKFADFFWSIVAETVSRQVKDNKNVDIFRSIVTEFDRLLWQWSQVVRFCDDHPDKLKARATFFLLTTDGEPVAEDLHNVFVAGVGYDDDGQRIVMLRDFIFNAVWRVGRRLITPLQ